MQEIKNWLPTVKTDFKQKQPMKIKHTKQIQIGNPIKNSYATVPEAKLVLVECKPEEAITAKRCSVLRVWGKTIDLYDRTVHFEPNNTPSAKYFKPVIISETEKIENGCWAYNKETSSLIKLDGLEKGELDAFIEQKNWFKVLALPEHFSPEQLQMIVGGKLKDGDKVLVECETNDPRKADYYDKLSHNTRTVAIEVFNDEGLIKQIKLNSSNHITLHKVEEKVYTREEVRELLIEFFGDLTSTSKSITPEQWFEQNVK